MKNRELERITTPKRMWEVSPINKKSKEVVGLDTETEEGQAFIIGISDGQTEEVIRLRTPDERLAILTQKRLGGTHNFFYNLTYDMQALFKGLPYSTLMSLAKSDSAYHNGRFIEVTPHKRLRITDRDGKRYDYYDLAQFYNYATLDKLGIKHYGEGKTEKTFDITRLSSDRYDQDVSYHQEIDHYLKRDAELCRLLGNDLINAASPLLKPRSFFSQAGFSQQYYQEKATRKIHLAPSVVMRAALQAYNGGRFETLRRGTIKGVDSYDIRSAYPYHAAKIPAIDKGTWTSNDHYEPESLLSIMNVMCEGTSHISPYRRENKNIIDYPTGMMSQWINKREYETLRKYGYAVKILKAYHYFDSSPEYPFSFMQDVYAEKEKVGKESPLYNVYKIIANGFYGKLIQMMPENDTTTGETVKGRWKSGALFNPIAAMEITANTRCDVLDATIDDQESVVAYHTDSIATTGRVRLKVGKEMGWWDHEKKSGTLTIIGCGVYHWHKDDRYEAKTKFRGFSKKTIDLSVFNNDAQEIAFTMKRNIKLKASSKRADPLTEFNLIKDVQRSLNVNFDHKRVWEKEFKDASAVLDEEHSSKPHVVR